MEKNQGTQMVNSGAVSAETKNRKTGWIVAGIAAAAVLAVTGVVAFLIISTRQRLQEEMEQQALESILWQISQEDYAGAYEEYDTLEEKVQDGIKEEVRDAVEEETVRLESSLKRMDAADIDDNFFARVEALKELAGIVGFRKKDAPILTCESIVEQAQALLEQAREEEIKQIGDEIAGYIGNLECADALRMYRKQSQEIQDLIREQLQEVVTDVWKNEGYTYIYNSIDNGETSFVEEMDVMEELAGILGFTEADPEIQMLHKVKELVIHMPYIEAKKFLTEWDDAVTGKINELNAQEGLAYEEIAQYFYQIEALSRGTVVNMAFLEMEDDAFLEDMANYIAKCGNYYNLIGQAYEKSDQAMLDAAQEYRSSEIKELEDKILGKFNAESEAWNGVLRELKAIVANL